MPWAKAADFAPTSCGFIFAASGRSYTTCAIQAARSLRAANPDFPIDIFTDQSVEDGIFDVVHPLEKSWFRPKFEALARSRFDFTVCLDADVFVLGDLSDIFTVLTRFDIAATQVTGRNQGFARQVWRKPIPNAFPQINTGVLGVRKSSECQKLLEDCQTALMEDGLKQDQPVIRELLFDSDLRIAVLPAEYNARNRTLWQYGGSKFAAPRILHHTGFHARMPDEFTPVAPETVYGRAYMRHVRKLVAADRQLSPGNRLTVPAPQFDGPLWRLRAGLQNLNKRK